MQTTYTGSQPRDRDTEQPCVLKGTGNMKGKMSNKFIYTHTVVMDITVSCRADTHAIKDGPVSCRAV